MQPPVLTIAEIKAQYPDQWGGQMREDNFVGDLIDMLLSKIME